MLKLSEKCYIFFWCCSLSLLQVIIIVFLTGSLSLVTVVGNILVLLSFKVNKALKTVNNYYLLSLAFADLTIGTLSMNLYTTYIIMDQWALGPVVCDLWLAIDYVASNASVMNLLVISFDRYCFQKKKIELCVKYIDDDWSSLKREENKTILGSWNKDINNVASILIFF